jgi:cation diffusion facilitator CzcD-associated flavoprotein CzcO
MSVHEKHKVVIIGTGFSGICSAISLQNEGIDDFVMLEKDDAMGGTWYANQYPGAAVDVQSYLYCFSFAPYNWSRIFALKDEIFAYTNYVIDKFDLRKKAKLNSKVLKMNYQDDKATWLIHTEDGNTYEAQYVFNSFGVLVDPAYPTIEGMEKFKGTTFHSARWNHNYDLKGKRVAVIGSAASAVQLIPEIAKKVDRLIVFQRTPHWVLPRPDRMLKSWERSLLQIKPLGYLYREFLYWRNEGRMLGFAKFPGAMKLFPQREALHFLKKEIKDPVLRKKMTPNFIFGCKRVLLTNEYYSTIVKPNVELQADGIKAITENGILLPNGEELKVDAIIYSTGFNVTNFVPFEITGKKGLSIVDSFKDGMHAYLGTLVPQFPNMFLTLGPNTGVGHTSALHIMESQVAMAIRCIKESEANKWKSFDINEKVEKDYNDYVQKTLQGTIWVKGGCKSWYQDANTGENKAIFPDFNFVFRRKAKNFKFSALNIVK